MQVSDIEKKPEHISSAASAANNQLRGIPSVTRRPSAALQDQLEDDLAAHVREQQRGESRERPVHGLAPAPAAEIVAREQAAEDEPGDESEDRLVRGGERPAEKLFREE